MPSLISRWAKRVTNPDALLIYGMGAMIDAASVRYALTNKPSRYTPGEPLKLLLAGYAGTRNTGGDVRVEEMIRQFRHILGDRNVELSIFTINPELTAGYFRTVRQIPIPTIFPKFLADECPKHHGVVACEGSMFKSKFSNALATMMTGALGLAGAEGKLSIGYGGEAGQMDDLLEDFVRSHCRHSLIICRNENSRSILDGLGVRTEPGTDTAWTFRCASKDRAEQLLTRAGWDGKKPVVAIAPINPFWWPAKPDLVKTAAMRLTGQYREDHYKSVVFHSWSEESARSYDAYISALAEALTAYLSHHDTFPILVGSEQLDRGACEDLAARLSFDVPLFVSDDHDMYDLVAVLRRCSMVASSRYHAIVNSMPAGVPSIGITMDERIHNLFHDRSHQDFLLRVDDEDLGPRLLTAMNRATQEAERLQREIITYLPSQLEAMAKMGMAFEDELLRVYPEFPASHRPRTVENFLPSLSPELSSLLEAST